MLAEREDVRVVGQTGDAEEAIQQIRQERPHVVILAIHMHEGSGIDVLKAVRPEQPSPVIIMLTNSAYAPYRRECMQAGANYFLDKSIEFEQINVIFDRLKRISRAAREEGNQTSVEKERRGDHGRAA
jgi:DNA-binding NarL/FixJ family response regulator